VAPQTAEDYPNLPMLRHSGAISEKELDTLLVVDLEPIPMSDEEIESIFDRLHLSTEEERRALAFESSERGDEANIEIQLVTHTGQQTEPTLLLHA